MARSTCQPIIGYKELTASPNCRQQQPAEWASTDAQTDTQLLMCSPTEAIAACGTAAGELCVEAAVSLSQSCDG